jgi:hypothetical protein
MNKLRERLAARRRRKAHDRYLAEAARQRALNAQDAQHAVRDTAMDSAAAQQGFYGRQ